MSDWVYFIHAPREHFGATMTEEEQAVWGEHMQLLQRRLDDGSLILAGGRGGGRGGARTWRKTPRSRAASRAASCGRQSRIRQVIRSRAMRGRL